jgi:hypothetical protein
LPITDESNTLVEEFVGLARPNQAVVHLEETHVGHPAEEADACKGPMAQKKSKTRRDNKKKRDAPEHTRKRRLAGKRQYVSPVKPGQEEEWKSRRGRGAGRRMEEQEGKRGRKKNGRAGGEEGHVRPSAPKGGMAARAFGIVHSHNLQIRWRL